MTVVQPVSFLHNRTDHTAQTDRLAVSALLGGAGTALSWRQGVRNLSDLAVSPIGTPNMTVDVAGGQAFIRQATAAQGVYVLTNDATVNLAVAAAHATLPRNDLVIARVTDQFFSGGTNVGSIEVVTGTAASSPSDPAVTGNAVVLARVRVTAAAAAITAGMIDDLRPIVTANGGIIPVLTTADRDALTAYRGLVVDNAETGNLERHNGTTWQTITTGSASGFTAYTPTVTGIPANATAQYTKVGKLVIVEFLITATGAATGAIEMTTPSTAAGTTGKLGLGTAILIDATASSERRGATVYPVSTTVVGFIIDSATSGSGKAGTGGPWTWAASDTVGGMFQYREV